MILLHLRPRILFSVPEIKQEYFHINRYPTIPIVVYITTILFVVCICLITSQRAVSDPPSLPSRHDTVHCLQSMWMYNCPPLWTVTIFTSPYLIVYHVCIVRSENGMNVTIFSSWFLMLVIKEKSPVYQQLVNRLKFFPVSSKHLLAVS